MNITKLDEALDLLETLHAVKDKLKHLDNILTTDTDKSHKRNLGGFLISPELYYSICSQIRQEYQDVYNKLKTRLEQL